MQGLGRENLCKHIVKAAEEATEAIVPILEMKAGTAAADHTPEFALTTSSGDTNPLLRTFDFTVCYVLFHFQSATWLTEIADSQQRI